MPEMERPNSSVRCRATEAMSSASACSSRERDEAGTREAAREDLHHADSGGKLRPRAHLVDAGGDAAEEEGKVSALGRIRVVRRAHERAVLVLVVLSALHLVQAGVCAAALLRIAAWRRHECCQLARATQQSPTAHSSEETAPWCNKAALGPATEGGQGVNGRIDVLYAVDVGQRFARGPVAGFGSSSVALRRCGAMRWCLHLRYAKLWQGIGAEACSRRGRSAGWPAGLRLGARPDHIALPSLGGATAGPAMPYRPALWGLHSSCAAR